MPAGRYSAGYRKLDNSTVCSCPRLAPLLVARGLRIRIATAALGEQFDVSFDLLAWELTRAFVFPHLLSAGDIYECPADYSRTVIMRIPSMLNPGVEVVGGR